MEKILHRANSLEQVQRARLHRADRLEADLHATKRGIAVTHDRPFGPFLFGKLGPFVAGRRGVVDADSSIPWIRRAKNMMPFSALIGQPKPLYLDLKGIWDNASIEHLAEALHEREREDDIVASLNLDLVDLFACIAPEQPVMYTLKNREQFIRLHQKPIPPAFLGIAVNAMAYNAGRDAKTVIRQMHNQDLLAFAWNIPDEDIFRLLAEQGLDGAIIDDLSWNC